MLGTEERQLRDRPRGLSGARWAWWPVRFAQVHIHRSPMTRGSDRDPGPLGVRAVIFPGNTCGDASGCGGGGDDSLCGEREDRRKNWGWRAENLPLAPDSGRKEMRGST